MATTADYAAAYVRKYGLTLVPLPPKTKRPLKKEWGLKDCLTTSEQAHAYYNEHPDWNIGAALGPSRLCSLDIDNLDAMRIICAEFGWDIDALLAQSPTIQGQPPGMRMLFRVPDGETLQYHSLSWPKQDDPAKRFTVFEIRAADTQQRQDVLPPSIHPDTGQPYIWLTKPNGAIPEPPAWLLAVWKNWDALKPQLQGLCPWAVQRPTPKPPKTRRPANDTTPSVIDAYDQANSIEAALTRYGYRPQGKRWLSPHSSTGLAGVVIFDGKAWIHHASDPLCSDESGQLVGAFDLFRYYEHGGDISKAVRAAAEAMGMASRSPIYVPPTESIDPDTGEINPSAPEYRTAEEVERMNLPAKFQGPPIDVFGDAPVPEIDRAMLPAAIADYAFDQAELMGVAPGMIAMPCIVACASVIHDGIELQPKRHETGWRESARLWCAVVGSPSVRKSPSLRRAISRLKKINRELCEANDRKQAAYAHEVEEWQDAKRAAKRHNETPPQAPEEPVKERLIVEDITVEAMSEILKHNARGVLCVQDELTGWFGAMDAYNAGKAAGKDRAHWLEMYNGGHHMVDRVLRGSIHVPNWSACMVGGIQPDMIRRIASQMGEDGLMQRFMVIMGRNAGNEQDRPEDERAKRAYNGLIDHLYGIQPGSDPVMMSEEAHLVRERVFDYAKEMTEYDAIPNGLKSHIGKWPGLFSRIALTYHVIDCAARGKHPNAENISGKTAECVERLMREYLLPHSMSYYTDILGQESHLEHVRWIAGHILSKKVDRLENREIVQAYKQWRGLQEWVRTRVLATLQELGWIMPAAGQPVVGKKPPTVWDVNPTAHEHYEQLAEREREKRQRLTERMRELGR
jgi:hypothetical protein